MTKKENLQSQRYAQRTLSPVVARLAQSTADEYVGKMKCQRLRLRSSTLADLDELRRDVFVELSIAIGTSTPHLQNKFEQAYNEALQNSYEWWYARRHWCIKLWRHQFGVERR